MTENELECYRNMFSVLEGAINLKNAVTDFLDHHFRSLFYSLMGMNQLEEDVFALKASNSSMGRMVYIDGVLYDASVNEREKTFILVSLNKKPRVTNTFKINRYLLRNLVETYCKKIDTLKNTTLFENLDQHYALDINLGSTLAAYILVDEEREKLKDKLSSLEVVKTL